MRTLTTALAAALLLAVAVVPATAQTGDTQTEVPPLRLEPCTGTGDPLTLEGASTEVAAPTPVDGSVSLTYRLDLSGQDVAEDQDMDDQATVTVDMSWLTPLDYDLEVNAASSAGFQPAEASTESASTRVKHCKTVTITVVNFAATGLESIALETAVRL